MNKLEEIKSILRHHREELRHQYRVREIGLFGSFVRGQQNSRSDIDILVELEEPVSLLGLVRIENHLCDILGIKVDLVPEKDIRPELKEKILKEVVYL